MPLAPRMRFLPLGLLISALLPAQIPDHVTPKGRARVASLGLEVVSGEVRLPARMRGVTLRLAPGETGLERPQFIWPESLRLGNHAREEALQRIEVEDHQAQVYRFFGAAKPSLSQVLQTYGKAHEGRGPASLDDPDFQRLLTDDLRKKLEHHALVPKADLSNPQAPLLVEIAPRLDDGQHWVFTTRLSGSRRPVDAELLRRTGQKLRRDRIAPLPPPPPGPDELLPFQVIGLRRGAGKGVKLEMLEQGRPIATLAFTYPTKDATDQEALKSWLRSRCFNWSMEAPLSRGLWVAAQSAYGKAGLDLGVNMDQLRDLRNRNGALREAASSGPSLLSLLGGRAAVDETLQLDREMSGMPKGAEVPLASLQGIATPPHPWAEMRKGKPAPALIPLADCVPLDRPLLHLRRPAAALASFEGGGASFLSRVNSFLGETRMDTSIVERALADLGLGSGLGRRILAAGGVKEAVVFSSDLAFLSGTEITLVAELAPLVSTLLPLPQEGIQSRGAAFWAKRGTRLFISTSRSELAQALALNDAGGQGSLGRSDEFAVVLSELAPNAETEIYAYLPDAFIRRLVGPRQRILQLRQATARQQMEMLAAAALLRRLDGPGESPRLDDLKRLGYVHDQILLEGLTLEADGRVRHRDFGALDHLVPLERIPLEQVSEGEAQGYAAFRESYSQYWRRYFDPIAFRLDAGEDGRMSLETFVLPLLDSSIYNGLKGALAAGERARPKWAVPLVAEFDLKAQPQLYGAKGSLGRLLDIPNSDLAETFTGSVAVGFTDSAPVIQVGSGSPATLLDASPSNRGADLMTLGAVALGAFTRPLVIALELKHPEALARDLQSLGSEGLPLPRVFKELEGRVSREPDGRLLVRLGFLGLASMRFTARVEDRWLVLSNDASLPSPLVTGTEAPSTFPAAFRLQPAALKLGLPAAFQAAMEGEAKAAWGAMAWLSPWLLSGQSAEAARAESHRLLGMAPLLSNEALDASNPLVHTRFGTVYRPRTPAFDPTGRFGMFEGVTEAEVALRFEGEGMRARVSWTR
jgi:hypothetical protein